jgi:hypothetical protein
MKACTCIFLTNEESEWCHLYAGSSDKVRDIILANAIFIPSFSVLLSSGTMVTLKGQNLLL